MRRLAVKVVLLLLAAAVLVPAPLPLPVQGTLLSTMAAVPLSAADAVGAAVPEVLAGPPPETLRVAPALQVRTLRATRAHTGRGSFYLVVQELAAGLTLPYVGSREGWVLVGTPNGGFGWVVGNEVELSDASGGGMKYALQPGRWEMRTPGGTRVDVARAGTGVMRVAVSWTAPGDPQVAQHDAATVAVLTDLDAEGGFEVGEGGVGAISLTRTGLLVDLESAPLYQVVLTSSQRVELEFRPGLAAAEKVGAGWRFRVRGDARPVLRAEGGALVLDLPGAGLAPGFAGAPPGAELAVVGPEPAGSGPSLAATATVPTRMPQGGVRLKLPARPEPYALYRPEPGVVELRFLSPGLGGKTVYLDPGHGGEETGAEGRAGLVEKHMNLAVALRLQALLAEAGATVIMARTADVRSLWPERERVLRTYSERTRADLEYRVATANKAGVDLYLSIHGNGGPAGDAGTETYWSPANLNAARSRQLAEMLQGELLSALHLIDRGVKQRGFHVIRYTDAPASLAELGFVTSPAEERLLASGAGQQAAAQALFSALQQFFAATAAAATGAAP